MVKFAVRRGDTLIEVMIAVGIFSMVAIAVVAVMNGGASSAQTSLEATLAREEIDTQAEALRFIQSSYVAEKTSGGDRYSGLWQAIIDKAIKGELGEFSDEEKEIMEYSPTSCDELYGEGMEVSKYGFVINPRVLGTFENVNEVINSGDKLVPASTYPHLVYGSEIANSDDEALVGGYNENSLYQAEGIYVIAVKDPGATNIIDFAGNASGKTSAYYDFYIRTCWYGTGDKNLSDISTLIRLYDPSAISSE